MTRTEYTKAGLFKEREEWKTTFAPQPGDIVAQEHWCSTGFANTDLDLQLKKHGIHKLIVIGLIATRAWRQLFALPLSLATRSRW
jgi:nicotinamidase-related amidase